ncbi:chromosomal replication initiator protein DnaA [Lactovum miscens]|uniref:Chromosomal replication initiator protein DnaA n=1 Tax=Lactovum miscens TaxID=190387 RepID=A0A841C714_9LACT|nr:chromosomal replication initiator protein DnaA [Lactovum miscens]MBB5887341.1 chromosomal replication initiator protein [Lactovum miscens]
MPLKESDKRFWNRVNELARQNLPKATYDYFIAPAKLISVSGNKAKILINSDMHKDFLKRQTDLFNTASLEVYGDVLTIKILSDADMSDADRKEMNRSIETRTETPDNFSETILEPVRTNLQKKYSFDNFVAGDQNRMTLAAALTITDSPGDLYNPLFIFGNSGLGKTHLLHAIGNEFLKKHPRSRLIYVSSEAFVTDYVNASRKKQMDSFVEKYRNLDLLLLDDVQFFSDKEGTKNEFFQTFNALHEKGAQIVLTSDRPPSELNNLEERLVSRFSWGLTTNITIPDFETRMAILMNKAEKTGLNFPDETISYIASQINSNVRELEGALNQVEFLAKMEKNSTVEISTAEKAIENLRSSNSHSRKNNLNITKIKDEVSKYFHLPVADLSGPKRIKEIAYARQVAMFLIRDLLATSLPAIGQEFGKRDHTTVMYAVRVITDKLKNDNETQRDVDNLKRKLEG